MCVRPCRYLAALRSQEAASVRAFAELVAGLSRSETWNVHAWLLETLSREEREEIAALYLPERSSSRLAALSRRVADAYSRLPSVDQR
jgi:hypothetical protein